jgi:hypothetical protein
MNLNWTTREHNPTFLSQLSDLSHFVNTRHVDPQQRVLHRLRKPNTENWLDYNTDGDCLVAMRHFYNYFVPPSILESAPHGFLGLGLSTCGYSNAAKSLLNQPLPSKKYPQYHHTHYSKINQLNSLIGNYRIIDRIPNYFGTYPLIFWNGSQLHYIGGYNTFSKEIDNEKHFIRQLLLCLQRCLPITQGLLHEQPMIVMTSDKNQAVNFKNGVRIMMPTDPAHEYFTIAKHFDLPPQNWVMDLRDENKITISPF